jgi:hypothetical protein
MPYIGCGVPVEVDSGGRWGGGAVTGGATGNGSMTALKEFGISHSQLAKSALANTQTHSRLPI